MLPQCILSWVFYLFPSLTKFQTGCYWCWIFYQSARKVEIHVRFSHIENIILVSFHMSMAPKKNPLHVYGATSSIRLRNFYFDEYVKNFSPSCAIVLDIDSLNLSNIVLPMSVSSATHIQAMGKLCMCTHNISLLKLILEGGVNLSIGLRTNMNVSNSHGRPCMILCLSTWLSNLKIKMLGLMSTMLNGLEFFHSFTIVECSTSLFIVRSAWILSVKP